MAILLTYYLIIGVHKVTGNITILYSLTSQTIPISTLCLNKMTLM